MSTLILSIGLAGCQTITLPLLGHQVGRPHASGSKFGVRGSVGAAVVPAVQDIVPEVRDPKGNVINPVPGEVVKDQTTGEAIGKEKEVLTIPVYDLSIAFAERFEAGYSTGRGIYLLWDVVRGGNYTFTLSPAYAIVDVSAPGDDLTVNSNSKDGSDSEMKGHLSNINLTALGSIFVNNTAFYSLGFYVGIGMNSIRAWVKDERTGQKEVGQTTAPTALIGVNGRLTIFDIIAEAQSTNIKQRDGKTRTALTYMATVSLKADWY